MKKMATVNEYVSATHESIKKTGITDPAKSKSHTISTEKIFIKNPQFKYFHKKIPCLEYLTTHQNLYLFGEDINSDLAKRFYAMDYHSIFQLSQQKKFHLYEYFERDNPLKLFLDIDVKMGKMDKDQQLIIFNKVCQESIDLVLKYLKLYNIQNPEIIILSSCREHKVSSHVIFNNVVFESHEHMKFFMSEIKSKLIEEKIIDLSVYKTGGFRMLWNSKYGINRNLEFHKGINYTYTTDQQLFMDCLLRNTLPQHLQVKINLPNNVKIIRKQRPKVDQNIIGFHISEYVSKPRSVLQNYVDLLDETRCNDYMDWLRVGMVLHNCNPSEKCFELWDEWSKQSELYSSKDYNAYKWNSFRFGYYSFGTLKHFAKQDNPEKYQDIECNLENPLFESIKFESDYLLNNEEEKIKDKKSFVSKYINDWYTGKSKTIALKSTYNTGKTRINKKIIEEFNPEKILFISYRQTLSNELQGSFKHLNVESYLDKVFDADRLICQIESLPKILPNYQFIDEILLVPSYDLVIIDEIESVLNHFRSSTIENKEKVFEIMRNIIFNSNKVLALDGDFHNRSYHYLKHFGDVTVLENIKKKNKKHFIFTNERGYFENSIDYDLANNKNIGLISMSSSLATFYYNNYHTKYKSILHCAKSDDKYKDLLKDVNSLWKQYQLVVYSPSIESGVNFDTKHFDKIYVILSTKSTSPRGLMQMISRIRQLTDNNVMIYLNNVPFREKSNFYVYDEIKEYVGEVFTKYLKPTIVLDSKINKMVLKYEFDLYAHILVYNEVEVSNKTKNLFVAYLIKLMVEKGHTYEHKTIRMNKNAYNKDTVLKDEILKANDIDHTEFNELLSKQVNNNATKEDKILIERYILKKKWKINEVSDDFLTKFYGKTYVLENLRCLLDKNMINAYKCGQKDDPIIDFDGANKLEQIKMIEEVISKLGFEKIGDDKKIERYVFEKNIEKVVSESHLFTNVNKSQPMFGYDKVKISRVKTVKQFMGFMNSLFSEWGIVIQLIRKFSSKIINKKKVTNSTNYFILNYINDINKHV